MLLHILTAKSSGSANLSSANVRAKTSRSYPKHTLPIGVSLSQVSLSSGAPPKIVLVSLVKVYPGL